MYMYFKLDIVCVCVQQGEGGKEGRGRERRGRGEGGGREKGGKEGRGERGGTRGTYRVDRRGISEKESSITMHGLSDPASSQSHSTLSKKKEVNSYVHVQKYTHKYTQSRDDSFQCLRTHTVVWIHKRGYVNPEAYSNYCLPRAPGLSFYIHGTSRPHTRSHGQRFTSVEVWTTFKVSNFVSSDPQRRL